MPSVEFDETVENVGFVIRVSRTSSESRAVYELSSRRQFFGEGALRDLKELIDEALEKGAKARR